MNTEGTIRLPDGSTIQAGHAGALHVVTDSYPINIIGWSHNGRTIYFLSHRDHSRGRAVDRFGKSRIRVATWRRPGTFHNPDEGCFRERGCPDGSMVTTDGHEDYRTPEF